MAPLTNCEVIAAKRTLAVMASHATLPPTGCVMVERFRRGHLAALRHAGSNLMAFNAADLLMLCMTKANPECLRERRRPRISAQLMTGAARRNIAAAGLRTRGMTSVASRVCVESRWYRKRHAPARRSMTRRAANATHLHMSRVIKFHTKTLQAWKRFERPRFYVGMTDRADGTVRI